MKAMKIAVVIIGGKPVETLNKKLQQWQPIQYQILRISHSPPHQIPHHHPGKNNLAQLLSHQKYRLRNILILIYILSCAPMRIQYYMNHVRSTHILHTDNASFRIERLYLIIFLVPT